MITVAQQPRYQHALKSLAHEGPASYIDLERRLGMPGMHRVVGYLQQHNMAIGLKKTARGEPRKYQITALGREAIGQAVQPDLVQRPSLYQRPTWTPGPIMPARHGSMAAFSIPSLAGRVPAHLS